MHVSLFKVPNPPPATLMLISDELEDTCPFISRCQQKRYYNLVLARTYTPPSMSCLYHTAEWLWQTLLARSQAITSYDLRKCTASGDSAWSFLCDACYFTYLSVTDFTRHLSSEEHKRRVSSSLIISLAWLIDSISLHFSLSNYLRVSQQEILTIKSSPHDEDEDEVFMYLFTFFVREMMEDSLK